MAPYMAKHEDAHITKILKILSQSGKRRGYRGQINRNYYNMVS
jgi:hypothetical protein